MDESTWASETVQMTEEGTCSKHPHIKLREKGEDGFIYKRESCPLCDTEYLNKKSDLKNQKAEVDRQLQEINDQEEQNENGDNGMESMHGFDAMNHSAHSNTSSSFQPPMFRMHAGGNSGMEQQPHSSLDHGYSRGPLTLESLSTQMNMMQQMQDWLLREKEKEMTLLRDKVEKQQKELLQKEVEIALLKEKLNHQEERMQQELKLLKIAALGRKSNKSKEIHIQELHVSVGNNAAENGNVDPKMVQAATAAATTAAIEGATRAHDAAAGGDPGNTSTSLSNPPKSSPRNGSRHLQQNPTSTALVPAKASKSSSRALVPSVDNNANHALVPAQQPEQQNGEITVNFGGDEDASGVESKEEEEGGDTYNADVPPWSSASNSTGGAGSSIRNQFALKEGPLINEGNYNRKSPMNASINSLEPQRLGGLNNGLGNSHAKLPTRAQLNAQGASSRPRGTSVPRELNVDQEEAPQVPLSEEVTLGTIDNFSRFTNDDEKSIGNTVASSTYGEDRQKVKDQVLLDPYGDRGRYSGIVLRSTGMPHGLGRMVYEEDQRTYEGDWRHGRWHGFGRATFANGDSYEGEYRFDQRHGRGKYCWSDGRIYDGEFSEDKRHGKGTFKWPDGATYDGDFLQGQREGHGRYTFSDGGYYVGNWVDGRYEGFGECHWEDGRQYVGEWRSGMAHGNGIEKYPDGRIRHDGQWINDEPVRSNSGVANGGAAVGGK